MDVVELAALFQFYFFQATTFAVKICNEHNQPINSLLNYFSCFEISAGSLLVLFAIFLKPFFLLSFHTTTVMKTVVRINMTSKENKQTEKQRHLVVMVVVIVLLFISLLDLELKKKLENAFTSLIKNSIFQINLLQF
ncbi:hypothetical protein T07_1845 [Trichinella nelsoni]|uniref:Uncharacterized protein n=1 Tax=Trichinella nelsoni TaxID=6336 RepID=A0A0V0RSF8_9BILA|nr:hypothetical protein T07_1845 [Trichinella nelsoni]